VELVRWRSGFRRISGLYDEEVLKRDACAATPFGRTVTPEHDPEKWVPVFRKDHAQTKR
jgi:hypothetical protein